MQRRSIKTKAPCDVVGGVRLFARYLQNSSLEFVGALREVRLCGQCLRFFTKGMPAPANVDEGGMYGQLVVRDIAQDGTMRGDADALSKENDLRPMFVAKRRPIKGPLNLTASPGWSRLSACLNVLAG